MMFTPFCNASTGLPSIKKFTISHFTISRFTIQKGESYRYGSPSHEKGIEQLNENGMQGVESRWHEAAVHVGLRDEGT
jgi:hypothetical protein